MKPSEIVFAPETYIPFKRRTLQTLPYSFVFTFVIIGISVWRSSGPENVKVHWPFLSFLFLILFAFIYVLSCLGSIKVLDSIVLDRDKKTLKIIIRKYDTIQVLGEYPVDKNLKLILTPRSKFGQALNFNFRVLQTGRRLLVREIGGVLVRKSAWKIAELKQLINSFEEFKSNSI